MVNTYTLAKLLLVQLDQHGELDHNNMSADTTAQIIRQLASRVIDLQDTAELLCRNLTADLVQLTDLQQVLQEDQ